MNDKGIETLQHDHTFGQDHKRPGEKRTIVVALVTVVMMGVEVTAGILSGSMALLADGLHMASHAAALSLTVFAYAYARQHAADRRFSFGTGKVNALGGYSGAVLLGFFALIMAGESFHRMLSPVGIAYDQAILVAVAGLIVNGACALVLGGGDHKHDHDHGDDQDHNLKAAYLHVLADALTSVLAIAALIAAKYRGIVWMDPLMGLVGAILVSRWSLGLLGQTGRVLLDREGPEDLRNQIRESLESDGDSRITDLHVWSIGPGIYSAAITVTALRPSDPEQYKKRIPAGLGLVHVTLETLRRPA